MQYLVDKFKRLKYVIIKWQTSRKVTLKEDLLNIESQVDLIYSLNVSSLPSSTYKMIFFELHCRKIEIIREEVATHEALWLANGDLNIEYFHTYAKKRRIVSSICQLAGSDGNIIIGQEDLKKWPWNIFVMYSKSRGI